MFNVILKSSFYGMVAKIGDLIDRLRTTAFFILHKHPRPSGSVYHAFFFVLIDVRLTKFGLTRFGYILLPCATAFGALLPPT
jgi:hypothetical protein